MACLLQRSRSTAKPQGSRRGYIPRDPEGDCMKAAAAQEGSANCWTQSIWKERLILKGNRKQGEDLFSKLLFICIIQKICICSVLRGCQCSKKT